MLSAVNDRPSHNEDEVSAQVYGLNIGSFYIHISRRRGQYSPPKRRWLFTSRKGVYVPESTDLQDENRL